MTMSDCCSSWRPLGQLAESKFQFEKGTFGPLLGRGCFSAHLQRVSLRHETLVSTRLPTELRLRKGFRQRPRGAAALDAVLMVGRPIQRVHRARDAVVALEDRPST